GDIDNAGELFGNHTRLKNGEFAPNGYVALAEYDLPAQGGNGDGKIDTSDAVFSELRLWVDVNHNGAVDPGELLTMSEAGVVTVDLKYKFTRKVDSFGNELRYRG